MSYLNTPQHNPQVLWLTICLVCLPGCLPANPSRELSQQISTKKILQEHERILPSQPCQMASAEQQMIHIYVYPSRYKYWRRDGYFVSYDQPTSLLQSWTQGC